ncbi:hypothetical protein MMC06_001918 [Schaereria dolodes]|nr:hypothetical protein [Schaereria dolodes]
MASLPPQPSPSQRQRDSSPPSSENTFQPAHRPSNTSPSTTSEDSQTVLLNNPPSPSTSHKADEQQKQIQSQPAASPTDNEPRKCWICFEDETEDTPASSPWRSPCPCALTAHESCLLDWVADLEAPNQRKTGARTRIECPQCKREITIARPRSLVVEGVNAVERVTGRFIVPGMFVTLAGSVFTGCWVHGLSSVYLVFGREDFHHMLGYSGEGISAKWGFGLPLIPMVLVMSRTTIADNLLPVLPILFFATQIPDVGHARNLDLWPPSAAMTVASLPYLRGAYNEIYKRVFAERERRWIKEIQPRSGENTNDAGAGREADNNVGENPGNGELGFEFNLEVEVFEEEENVDIQNNPNAPNVPPQGQAQNGIANVAHLPQQQQPAAHAPAPAPAPRGNNLIVSTSRLADTIIGALFFPTISAAMGAILKVSLPKGWTTPPSIWDRHRPGLLQTRWGRSIVGGCLFVVLKDTLLLYSRYRLAQDHRKRRVVDYERKKAKDGGS